MERPALVLLAAISPLALCCLLMGGVWANLVFPLLVTLFPLTLIAAATAGQPRRAWRRAALAALAVCLTGGTATLLVLERWPGQRGIYAGLSAATWVMLIGMGLAPLLLVAVWHLLAVDSTSGPSPPTDRRAAP